MRKVFCDVCERELTRNMVTEKLVVTDGGFSAEVIVSKDGVSNEGDLCYDCLLSMLTTKPKRKYTRSVKLDSVANDTDTKANLVIHTPTGLKGDTNFRVTIRDAEASGPSLRLTVLEVLRHYGDKIPDFLTDRERKQLEGILNAKKEDK